MGRWAVDLGTSSTVIARWDPNSRSARPVVLGAIARPADPARPLQPDGQIPSVLEALPADWLASLSCRWPLRGRVTWGRLADIGEPARARNAALPRPAFCSGFKSALLRDPQLPVARLGDVRVTARDATRRFLRELFATVRARGDAPASVVFTTPIEAYEAYRAELRDAATWCGVPEVRFVDEPIAAALGYGLGLGEPRRVLIFDMDGGTLHVAMVALQPRGVAQGEAEVLAKHGRPVGGNLVDRWVLEAVCGRVAVPLDSRTRTGEAAVDQVGTASVGAR